MNQPSYSSKNSRRAQVQMILTSLGAGRANAPGPARILGRVVCTQLQRDSCTTQHQTNTIWSRYCRLTFLTSGHIKITNINRYGDVFLRGVIAISNVPTASTIPVNILKTFCCQRHAAVE